MEAHFPHLSYSFPSILFEVIELFLQQQLIEGVDLVLGVSKYCLIWVISLLEPESRNQTPTHLTMVIFSNRLLD